MCIKLSKCIKYFLSVLQTLQSANIRDKFKEPRDKVQKKSKKRKVEEDEFDPMDPSSYSDAPRGGWGVGKF